MPVQDQTVAAGNLMEMRLSNFNLSQARPLDYMVASNGSKTAYLSGVNEITVLNYEPELADSESMNSQRSMTESESVSKDEEPEWTTGASNVLTVRINLQPSLIAVGPKHLAVALNNRVDFYQMNTGATSGSIWLSDEQEYVSNVAGMSLSSRFVAVLFDDKRLKLHALRLKTQSSPQEEFAPVSPDDEKDSLNEDLAERFFPDPTKCERISSFVTTEKYFIYSTFEYRLNVFDLETWMHVQTLDHSQNQANVSCSPLLKLKPNRSGNKFTCITRESPVEETNVYLYDLYNNSLVKIFNQSLYAKLFKAQSITYQRTSRSFSRSKVTHAFERPRKLNKIQDAIWDTDGRMLLLIEKEWIHVCVVLDHTLEREESIVEFVASEPKSPCHTALYASFGIVSYQTSTGQVINSVLQALDDDLRLSQLKQQIQNLFKENQIKLSSEPITCDETRQLFVDDAQIEVVRLKLNYLREVFCSSSLTKCKEVCEYLILDRQFNCPQTSGQRDVKFDVLLWRQLAAWALFTMDLKFALTIYRKNRLIVEAFVLTKILEDAQRSGLDFKASFKTRILILLGCDNIDEDKE